MNLYCRPIIEIATYNEVFTVKGNSTKESMFKRIPQNGLKENIIIKQRKGKQAWAHLTLDKNSRSNYSLLDHFHNESIPKKVEVDMLLVLNDQHFSVMSLTVNISGFVGHMIWVSATQI